MNIQEIISNLQCNLDLMQFDPLTGETIDKSCMNKLNRELCTALEEAIKELQKKSWIPVNDSLPEEIHTINYYALVCGEASFTESDMVLCRVIYNREIQYVTGIFTGGQWYLYHDMYNEETEELHVTHWMPLPEPPEQKGEES